MDIHSQGSQSPEYIIDLELVTRFISHFKNFLQRNILCLITSQASNIQFSPGDFQIVTLDHKLSELEDENLNETPIDITEAEVLFHQAPMLLAYAFLAACGCQG